MRKEFNIAELLKEIRGVGNELEVSSNLYDTLDETKQKYYTYYQQTEDTNTKHVEAIKDLVAAIKHYGRNVCNDTRLIEHEQKKDSGARDKEIY